MLAKSICNAASCKKLTNLPLAAKGGWRGGRVGRGGGRSGVVLRCVQKDGNGHVIENVDICMSTSMYVASLTGLYLLG